MRILIYGINYLPEPTGIGKYTGEMAQWLAARGHEVRVVTAQPSYPQWRIFPGYRFWVYSKEKTAPAKPVEKSAVTNDGANHIETFRCPIWIPKKPQGWGRLLHLASFSLSSIPSLLCQLGWSPEIVLLVEPTFFCAPQALIVARLLRAKSWLHVQDFEVDAAFGLGGLSHSRACDWALAIERRILRSFDRVSAISQRMVERLSVKGVDSARRIMFPNWVDTEKIFPMNQRSPFRKELGVADSKLVALYSGSMGKKQGLELLAGAATRLSCCTDLHFVICGEGPSRKIFEGAVKKLPNLTLLPIQPAERLNDLLNLADIHLLPQVACAADLVMPSKLTGMMASGRAILATADPGTQLFEALEGTGLVTPPGDTNTFVSSLLKLVEDAALRERLGRAAREQAVSHLDREAILGQFEQALLNVCGASSAAVKTNSLVTRRRRLAAEEGAAAGNAGED